MSILKSLADVMDLKYSTQEVQNLQKQSCNNALMAKKSPKDNKCPKSQEIRRRKNSQVNTGSQKIYQIYQGIPYDQGRMGENSQEQNKIKSSKRSERER